MSIKGYRLVRGYGGARRIVENMPTLTSDDEAREWYWRRWGNDERVTIQKATDYGWKNIPRALRE